MKINVASNPLISSLLFSVVLIAGLMVGCSKSETDDKTTSTTSQAPEATTMQKSAPVSADGTPTGGKVIKAMHAGGYTYMQVENQGKQFWVAATMMNVKRNDHVIWGDAAVMKKFTSTTLRRTFDEILFVSAVKIQ